MDQISAVRLGAVIRTVVYLLLAGRYLRKEVLSCACNALKVTRAVSCTLIAVFKSTAGLGWTASDQQKSP